MGGAAASGEIEMLNMIHLPRGLVGVLAAALLWPGFAAAQDRDAQEVASYTMTDAGLAKYTKATKSLAALPGSKPGDCDTGDDSMSLTEMVAALDGVPGAKGAIQSAGMTTREYVVFSWSILHNGLAAWAISQPGGKLPAGTSKANVDFYQKHEAELQQLDGLKQDGECDEDTAEDEYEE
jgi:hypothetical protein